MKKMKKNLSRIGFGLFCVLAVCSLVVSPAVGALKVTDGTPVTGASIGGNTGAVKVYVSGKGIVDWTTLNTDSGELLEFLGDSGFAVLNRVNSGARTDFMGNLKANGGHVIIVNPHGLVFGPDSIITASQFTASTLALDKNKFLNRRPRTY